jgi:hypothetical protein
MNPFNELSFREKSILISLCAILYVYGNYFAGLLNGAENTSLGAMLGSMIGVVIALVIIEVILHIVIAVFNPEDTKTEARDERDRAVNNRASRISYLLLSTGVVIILSRVLIRGAMDEAGDLIEVTLYEVANLLLLLLVLSELVNYGAQLYYYRRGV